MNEVTCVYHDRAPLGEGVFWSEREQKVYWVDIEGYRVNRYDPETGENLSVSVGGQVGAAVETVDGTLLLGMKDGVYEISFPAGAPRKLCDPTGGDSDNRLNDGKAGPDGRLYIGAMGPEGLQKLYRVERDKRAFAAIESGITCSNGMCWSLDRSVFYYIDSPTREVWAYDFDLATGGIADRRVAVNAKDLPGTPDGMTIDAEGKLWVAFWDGGCVRRYDPDTGEMLRKIDLPVSRVTTCAFGGPDLEDLYITTASIGFSEDDWRREPLAGGLFVCRPGVKGIPGYVFGA